MHSEEFKHAASVVLTHRLDHPLQQVLRDLSDPHIVTVDDYCPVFNLAWEQTVSDEEINVEVCQID